MTGTDVRLAVPVRVETTCRLCGSEKLVPTWTFGETPLANAYVRADQLDDPESRFPLEVARCLACELVQLRHTVSPDLLFRDYLYLSSTSPRFVAHFAEYAAHLAERFNLTPNDLVVEIGSNDGILLKPLRERGIRILGIEPASRIAAMAAAAGIETIPDFFSPDLARRIRAKHGPARIVTANNVFAHLPDLDAIVTGVRTLLADDGAYVFEVQYLGDLLFQNLFDIVYHEHLCYYHLAPLVSFFPRHGLEVFDVARVSAHGGSLRVFVQHAGGPPRREERLASLLADERRQGLATDAPYAALAERIAENRRKLTELLAELKGRGKRIAGYGAPAKATTFLHVFGLGREIIEYVVDDDRVFKQGRFLPGTHLPIVSPDRLYVDQPDYCLILAWNFAEPIIAKHARFTERGGRFIVPVPEPRII